MGTPYIMIGKKACRDYEVDAYGRPVQRGAEPATEAVIETTVSEPLSLPQVAGIDTNQLSYNALDRALGRTPRDRGDVIDPAVCFADIPPVGWEALGGVERLVVKNDTDSPLELTVTTFRGRCPSELDSDGKCTSEPGAVRQVKTALGFVGFPEYEGYHLPLMASGHGTVLPPHTTCYTRLPTNRAGVWSVRGELLVHTGDFGEWVQEADRFEYSAPLQANGRSKTYGVRSRSQPRSLIVFRESAF